MSDSVQFPRLYAIVDEGLLQAHGLAAGRIAEELKSAGVTLVQYRNKVGEPDAIVRQAVMIWEVLSGSGGRLIMNDHPDLVKPTGFDGVHLGQGDMSPENARHVVGATRWVGVSTHIDEQVRTFEYKLPRQFADRIFKTNQRRDLDVTIR